tara:strand:+ start:1501 stop:1764 length:264 start_codon:yes stop_codon:yes gene_type:complete
VANTLNSTIIPLSMDDVDVLKQKIKTLESQIDENQTKHESELSRVKSENYEALEASQTRYQGELEIQRMNFQRQIEGLKAKLRSFEV